MATAQWRCAAVLLPGDLVDRAILEQLGGTGADHILLDPALRIAGELALLDLDHHYIASAQLLAAG